MNFLSETDFNIVTAIHLLKQATENPKEKIDNVEFSIIISHGIKICVIPGTRDSDDINDDLLIEKVDMLIDGATYKVHKGFLSQFEKIWLHVSDCDMFIGHSLGGAIAQICALKSSKPIITFGSPRVGDYNFCKAIKNHLRITSRGDLIPHIPPWWVGYIFHSGEHIRIGKSSRPWWKFWIFTDHFINDYVQSVEEYFENNHS